MADAACETQFRAALAVLADVAPPEAFERAVRDIEAAAGAGHVEAMERLALLEWRGLGGQRHFEKALDSLATAAKAGSKAAAQQLILLAEERFDPSPGAEPDEGWAGLRSRIAILERVAPKTSARSLSASPFVLAISDFLSVAECQWLIAKASPSLARAGVYNSASGDDPTDPGGIDSRRTNRFALLDFARADIVVDVIQLRIANQIRAPASCLEVPQVLHYSVGQEFAPHCDFLDADLLGEEIARHGQRAATAIVYLNDDFEGGETSFSHLGLQHRGRTGDALVFGNVDAAGQPDPRTEHAGCPPTRGEKWVFSQWVRDRPITRG